MPIAAWPRPAKEALIESRDLAYTIPALIVRELFKLNCWRGHFFNLGCIQVRHVADRPTQPRGRSQGIRIRYLPQATPPDVPTRNVEPYQAARLPYHAAYPWYRTLLDSLRMRCHAKLEGAGSSGYYKAA